MAAASSTSKGTRGARRAAEGAPPGPTSAALADGLDALEASPERCQDAETRLEAAVGQEFRELVDWIVESALPLSLSRCGTRVVQRLLDVGGKEDRQRVLVALEPHVGALCESPHGNHVLSQLVAVLPSASLGGLIRRLQVFGPRALARHQFGCRILERILEHCSERETSGLFDEIVADAAVLCRHPYSNFVVKHLLEFGSPQQRADITEQLLPNIAALSMHRTASHVVQAILRWTDASVHAAVAAQLLRAESPNALSDVACNRYGSFVLEHLLGLGDGASGGVGAGGDGGAGGAKAEIVWRLAAAAEALGASPFGARVARGLGLEVGQEAMAPPPSPGSEEGSG